MYGVRIFGVQCGQLIFGTVCRVCDTPIPQIVCHEYFSWGDKKMVYSSPPIYHYSSSNNNWKTCAESGKVTKYERKRKIGHERKLSVF